MNREEFAAQRSNAAEAADRRLLPVVTRAIQNFPEPDWFEPIITEVLAIVADTYHDEGGEGEPPVPDFFVRALRDTLSKTKHPDVISVNNIVPWLSTSSINEGTQLAGKVGIAYEWVTMHDNSVREAHKAADGQMRTRGEKFLVGGVRMAYPGDPTAPIELWINCRCMLRPVAEEAIAARALGTTTGTTMAGNSFIYTPNIGITMGSSVRTYGISEKSWDGSAGRFTPEEWKRSCILHLSDGMEKSQHKLPIKEPNGDLSRAGVHAAASRIGQVDAPPAKVASAKSALRGAYRRLGEDPPESLGLTEPTSSIEASQGGDMPEKDQTDTEETQVPDLLPWHGVLAPEGVRSGDGRTFAPGSLTHRDLPLPLTWQKSSAPGHDGSVTVASIDKIAMIEGMMHASGQILPTPEADEFVGLIAHFGRYGVSVDADDAEFDFDEETGEVTFTKARVCSASGVGIPAFAEANIMLGDFPDDHAFHTAEGLSVAKEPLTAAAIKAGRGPGWLTNPKETKRIHDYWTRPGEVGYEKIGWGTPDDFYRCKALVGEEIAENSPEKVRFLNQICSQWHKDATGFWPGHAPAEQSADLPTGDPAPALELVASGGIKAPAKFFANPGLTERTHLTVTDTGWVYGHLAEWGACHIGFNGVCVEPPHSQVNYAHYANKKVLLDDGTYAHTGVISLGGGHAEGRLNAAAAVAHYDNVSTAAADVCVGEDEIGIWFSGMVRPGTTDEQVYALRASDVSGDWREVNGSSELELVAALACNVGGFKTRVTVEDGAQVALVAAGAIRTEAQHDGEGLDEFAERLAQAMENRAKRRERAAALAVKFRGE